MKYHLFILYFVFFFLVSGCSTSMDVKDHPVLKSVPVSRTSKFYISGIEQKVSEGFKEVIENNRKLKEKYGGDGEYFTVYEILEVPDEHFETFKNYLFTTINLAFKEDTTTQIQLVSSLEDADFELSFTSAFFHNPYKRDNRDNPLYWLGPTGWSHLYEEHKRRQADKISPRKGCDFDMFIRNVKTNKKWDPVTYIKYKLPVDEFAQWDSALHFYGVKIGKEIFDDLNELASKE